MSPPRHPPRGATPHPGTGGTFGLSDVDEPAEDLAHARLQGEVFGAARHGNDQVGRFQVPVLGQQLVEGFRVRVAGQTDVLWGRESVSMVSAPRGCAGEAAVAEGTTWAERPNPEHRWASTRAREVLGAGQQLRMASRSPAAALGTVEGSRLGWAELCTGRRGCWALLGRGCGRESSGGSRWPSGPPGQGMGPRGFQGPGFQPEQSVDSAVMETGSTQGFEEALI